MQRTSVANNYQIQYEISLTSNYIKIVLFMMTTINERKYYQFIPDVMTMI